MKFGAALTGALLIGASAAAVLVGPVLAEPANASAAVDLTQAPSFGTWGFDAGGEDRSVKPGDDFYRFAQGKAADALVIPADHARYSRFDTLQDLSEARSRQVIEAAANAADPVARKINALYTAFTDEARLEALGAAPLQPDLDKVRAARTHEDIAKLMALAPKSEFSSWFDPDISADPKTPDRYAVLLYEDGLNLPDRDYYLTPQFAAQKAKYQDYVAATLQRIGWPDAAARAKAIVDLETQVAEVSWTRAQRREADKTYNPMSVDDLAKAAPGFPWRVFLDAADLGDVQRVIVRENTAFPKIAAIYAQTPVETLKAWVAFALADHASPYLSKAFDKAHFDFHSTVLSGTPEQKARWKRAVALVNGAMGEALGKLYVQAYFPPQSKAQMLALIGNLRTALGARIQHLDWMSPETKTKALEKLRQLTVKVGYPDKWRDYSGLVISPTDLYGDVTRADAFDWAYHRDRINKPVDRQEWLMTPQTVNAYYLSTNNEITFPAAILQPPFFDPKADPAVNYGAIGQVIGHEMTHGFDDQGRKSDGAGALRDWWTAADAERFDARANQLADQYSAYTPLPGAHINGRQTLGENIADLGGAVIAYDAYHASLHGQPAPVIDGLTGDQRFFLGWAQLWMFKEREDAERQQLASDPHSPGDYRINGVAPNLDAWYAAFDVQPGDKLYRSPDQRVRIW
ncbi:MAG TPA: M13 family metallopeptidase [Caulobacteraceae bacterium]|nr:M13 family metallopeptidase [Caulobacteraceae bacterium]